MSKYVYLEMGSRNKKTGKLPKYKVIVKDDERRKEYITSI